MRGAELSPESREDRHRPPIGFTSRPPTSFPPKPVVFAPHPPLKSGGWYQGAEQEVDGPGRYPMARPVQKSRRAALLWTLFFGPLGLSYVSVACGLIAAAVAAVVILAGGILTLAIIWPVAMVLAVLAVPRRRPGHRPDPARAWFLSND